MNEIDYTKAYVALPDGTVWQVLDENGECDDMATAQAVMTHLEAANAA